MPTKDEATPAKDATTKLLEAIAKANGHPDPAGYADAVKAHIEEAE